MEGFATYVTRVHVVGTQAACCVMRDLIQLSSQRIDLNRLGGIKSEAWVRLSMLPVVVVAADH